MTTREAHAAVFCAAADALDPERAAPIRDPRVLSALLCVHAVRGHTRWLDSAAKLVAPLEDGPLPGDSTAWLAACCEGWVQRATGPFRRIADRLVDHVEPAPAAVPAWLRYWRITGRRTWRDRAMEAVPEELEPGDVVGAAACWAAFRATADTALADRARAALRPLATPRAPVERWSLLADALDLGAGAFEAPVPDASPRAAAEQLLGSAAVGLPVLEVIADWYLDVELTEGPVAEAATFPWPALRLRFERLPIRDQVRFRPFVDGIEGETLLDAGVISSLLENLVGDIDRGPFVGAVRKRRGGGLLRRR